MAANTMLMHSIARIKLEIYKAPLCEASLQVNDNMHDRTTLFSTVF